MKEKLLNPKKTLLLFTFGFVYLILTFQLSVAVPAMLREADTVSNLLGFVAVFAWFACTGYIGMSWHNRNLKTKQGK